MKKSSLFALFTLLSLLFLVPQAFADSSDEVNLIPAMTSNTSPSGVASASSEWSTTTAAYRAFDGQAYYGWATKTGTSGWVAYEFDTPTVVNKYKLSSRSILNGSTEAPKDWTFEGWDGTQWVALDTQSGISNWQYGIKKEFSFTNEKQFKKYRLNVTSNNGYNEYLTIGALEMYNTNTKPNPPEPTPEPSGDRAILTIIMTSGLEKEFDLSMDEVNSFINWYDAKDAGTGPSKYAIDKHNNNKGPFNKRTDYVIFNNILTFEVNEYSSSSK
ncbi:discoidin domain-containing protein [Paenibacillus donghaensis]|uniref:discoidin domain-containing protein n=1 Tax=Paenibacillus donghaensis TaxID=414771 RepID=UPI00188459D3|nr:discoidin domain-containing protein [Paenibacillus donghaensis]MBE9914762.1 discoidin domain-containing protein [Paenibacillus donghaensis]